MCTVLDHAPPHWPSGLRMVALVIADHVDDDGLCWPSVTRVARRAGLSQRQARKYLTQLETEGVIARYGRPGSSNHYTWHLWTELSDKRGVGTP